MQIKKLFLIASLLMVATFGVKAASGTWTNDADGNWSGTGNWLNGIVADASTFTADFSTINLTASRTVTLDAAHTLTTLKFGDALPDFNWTLSGGNTLTLAGTAPAINVLNQNTTISSVIAGTVGMTKFGAGTLTLGGATELFTGGLIDSAGKLTLDYNASGSPVSTLVPSQALTMGGGTLNINGNAGAASSQAFSSIVFNPGLSVISAAPASGANNPTLSLGGWTANRGALVRFIGPATIGAGNVSVPATATITTTTVGSGATGGIFLGEGPAVANPTAAFGTVGLYDWASTSLAGGTAGTSPYTIIGGSQVTGFYNTAWGFNNVDVTSSLATIVNSSVACSVRFNDPTTPTLATGGGGNLLFYGVLVTPNMGVTNTSLTGGGTWQVTRITNPNGAQTGTIWQNNTRGYFIMTPVIADGREGSSDPVQVAKGGDGTVTLASGSTYTGTTYVNGGNLLITANTCLGSATAGTTSQLNGGAIVGDGSSFALDNGASTKRGITLLGNGGGLAATAGNTLTVDGVVAGANGTGPLTIGIPASSANGNVAGLLPGSGSIANGQTVDTANPTPVFATGTVVLNFPNGVSGNTFFGGVNIVGGATLNINSEYALGGANQGPTVFNGGTLQYNATLATGAAGTALDISGQPVTFAGNATIDVNTHAINFANAIGRGGSGTLTVLDSTGSGSLMLAGGGNYTNSTIVGNSANQVALNFNGTLASRNVAVTSGATFGGTGTVAGDVTWASGATASFTAGSPMTVSGTATLNNNTVVVNVPGAALTPIGSPFTLMTAGSIAGGSTVSSAPTLAGNGIAPGYTGVVSISGNSVILTVSGSSTIATWTDGNATEKWSQAGNWSGGLPHLTGDLASFGTGGVGLPVNLDTNETVGVVSFNNASSYTITGANALTFDNNGSGAAITVTAGTVNAINTALSLNDNVTATVASGTAVTLGGVVTNASVPETLTATGSGTVVISQANSYGPSAGAVGTTLGGSTIQLGNSGALGAGDVNVTANSTLQAGLAGLNVANNITLNSTKVLTVDNNGNNLTLGGLISGGGALTKIGTGTLALSGNNSYSGNTTVNVGALSLSSAANLASSTIVLNGGDLLGNGTFAIPNNIGIGPVAGATPGTALIDAASGQTFEVDGIIATAGNTGANNLTVNALASTPGTVVLGGANTFNGTTIISNGVLQVANAAALQNSTLNYNNQGGSLSFGTLTAATLGALTGTQNLSLLNTTPAGVTLTVGNGAANTYAGDLSGTGGSLNKAGAGTFTLTGTNNYSGATSVSAGVLQLNPTGVITNGSAASVFANGAAQLLISGGSFTAGSLAVANPSVGLLVSSGAAVINGNVTLNNGNAASDSLIAITGGSLTANNLTIGRSSVSSGTQPTMGDATRGLYINGGALNLSGNLVVGAANANSAVSARIDSGSLSVAGSVTIGLNNGGRWAVLDINGGTFTVNDTATGVSLGQSVAGNAELIVRNGTATVGKISMGQGTTVETAVLSLANLGSLYVGIGGIAQVSTGVGFVSTITLGDGTLGHGTLGAAGDWMSSLPMTLAGATIQTADAVNTPHNITLNGTLSGTTLTKTGNGTLILGAPNTYTGATTISAGTLALNGSGAIDTTPLISVAGGAVLDVSGLGAGLTLTSGQVLSNSASATGIINGNLNTGSGAVSVSYVSGTPAFTITNGTFTLASGTTFNVNNTGAALAQGNYKLISTNLNGSGFVSGGTLPSVTVGGNGVSGAGSPALQINNSELYLVVSAGVNTNPTNITAVVTGGTLSLTWPGDHLGWTLQTNSVDLANTNFWFPYPGSSAVTNVNITIDPAQPNVFFRLVYP